MKRLFILLTLLLGFKCQLFGDDFEPKTVVFKVKPEYIHLIPGEKDFERFFQELLGSVKVVNAINPQLIDWTLAKYKVQYRTNSDDAILSLKRIFIARYESGIDPLTVSSKLKATGFFEYVEPLFVHHLAGIPNDSLIGRQYYLEKIKAIDAWQLLENSSGIDTIIVAVVDTGVDIDHLDLKDNIFYNIGEMGIDSTGKDKRFNNVDDDGNGYVDDYVGWDFVGANGSTPDNDPRPGNGHGTHVAGIIGAVANNSTGIAGVVPKVKILPVKASSDELFNPYISKGYEGIFYAAAMGAKVINCSWGSQSGSNLENDVIRAVNSLNVCVVGAAGNDNKLTNFTPASYDGVLSVAAVDSADKKAAFSNYSPNVDVSAPGTNILSTVPGNNYDSWNGTSMAAPIASGVVALARQKFPYLNYNQIYELVKTQSDNIDSLNQFYVGLIGYGRVNAFKSMNVLPDTIHSIILTRYEIKDENEDGLIIPGEKIRIYFTFKTIFSPLKSVYVKMPNGITFVDTILKSVAFVGDITENEEKTSLDYIEFTVSNQSPFDYTMFMPLDIYDSLGFIRRFFIQLNVNPSYKTMIYNKIKATFNSRGNIGFNDYPANSQGIGLSYLNSPNILFEGGLLLGFNQRNVYDVVRSANQNSQSRDFVADSIFSILFEQTKNAYVGETVFHSFPDSLDRVAFVIKEQVIQPLQEMDSNKLILVFRIENKTGRDIDSLFIGLFFDWDIGISGQSDQCLFDVDFNYGAAFNTQSDTLPLVGVKVLGNWKTNFYAIDNDGRGEDSIGIYDGFAKSEKWRMLSGSISRRKSRVTDASFLISAGPISVPKDSVVSVPFALFAGSDFAELRRSSLQSDLLALKLGIIRTLPESHSNQNYLVSIFPNPTEDEIYLRISFIERTPVEIFVYDLNGRLIHKFSYIDNLPWTIEQPLGLRGKASGNYFVQIRFPSESKTFLVSKVK
jgi:serine protease